MYTPRGVQYIYCKYTVWMAVYLQYILRHTESLLHFGLGWMNDIMKWKHKTKQKAWNVTGCHDGPEVMFFLHTSIYWYNQNRVEGQDWSSQRRTEWWYSILSVQFNSLHEHEKLNSITSGPPQFKMFQTFSMSSVWGGSRSMLLVASSDSQIWLWNY